MTLGRLKRWLREGYHPSGIPGAEWLNSGAYREVYTVGPCVIKKEVSRHSSWGSRKSDMGGGLRSAAVKRVARANKKSGLNVRVAPTHYVITSDIRWLIQKRYVVAGSVMYGAKGNPRVKRRYDAAKAHYEGIIDRHNNHDGTTYPELMEEKAQRKRLAKEEGPDETRRARSNNAVLAA